MKYLSNAKINLNLVVTGIDDKGYHLLYSVMAPVSLYDEIDIEIIKEEKIIIECNKKDVPTDERNIITKCINELKKERKINCGFRINLVKKIPSQAGLGGGSSNGATVLKAINEMLNLRLSKEELSTIGAKVGADIPFFIHNKMSLVEGIGDRITPLFNEKFKPYILLIKPAVGIDTKQAFSIYDKMMKTKEYTPLVLHNLIEENKVKEIYPLIKNDLQRTATSIVPEIEKISKFLIENGADASCMSGSGSCCFGIFEEEKNAQIALEKAKEKYDFVKITKIV